MSGKKSELAICLVSGGMDSLTTAAIANEQYSQLAFLHLNYGQKTEKKELDCFHKIADHFKVPKHLRKVVDMGFLKEVGGSSLTDQKIAVTDYHGDSDEIPSSYVPFRNTHIVALAVSWAEILKAKKIYIGAVEEDSSGYPDCRESYYKAYNLLIKEGTKDGDIEVMTPIIHMSKEQVIKKALELKAPLALTWSCYAREDKACGICDSCALRLRGFEKAKIVDPIEYVTRPKYT
ncbi:MAG: 7-cyano-7-deazaguanine synthase QueC [Bacteriovoracaceae bacterium]|nr:7-cyano-7-deazaguanine synthase QueC [Bacteriovoracaceae bacterium]